MLLLAALVGAAAMSANAGVRFGVSIGLPVVVATPVPPPLPVIVETVPPCPIVGYVWTPGYWTYRANHYVWISGA